MTEKELNQLFWLNKEAATLQKELNELEMELRYYDGYKGVKLSHTKSTASFDAYDKLGDLIDKIQLRKDEMNVMLKKIQRERLKLERFINSIEDSQMRLIFRLRHINGMTWQQIADELIYEFESTPRKKHKRYIKKLAE